MNGERHLRRQPQALSQAVAVPVILRSVQDRIRAGGLAVAASGVLLAARWMAAEWVAPLGLAATLVLAYTNGANDVSKGIATLVGAGVTDERRALRWGMLWTGLGGLASALLARTLVATFGASFLARGVSLTPVAALAIPIGALAWVLLATRTGLPVSTTHTITGAIIGAGVLSAGVSGVTWAALGRKIVLPLLASPVLAVGLGLLAYALVRPLAWRLPLSALHWLSSGGTSCARALNDTPKIVALGLTFAAGTGSVGAPLWLFLAVATAMAAGSWAGGRRVTRTLAERVTRLDDRAGFAANLASACLVAGASRLGLPVSTTHVSSGAIIGIGARRGWRAVRWRTVGEMALAWIITLPGGALLAAGAILLLR